MRSRAHPVARQRRGAARHGDRRQPHRPLGPRRGHRPVRPGQADLGPARQRRDQRPLRRAADEGEGRRPPRRRVPAGARDQPAAAPEPGWRRPRGAPAARAPGEHATFLGWLEGEELARAYASADVFLFASRTDTFGQVLLEAQASGLPVVAVNEGGPCSIVEDGVTGLLRDHDADALAAAVNELANAPLMRERLARNGLAAVRERTWDAALGRLAAGYHRALQVGGVARDETGRRVA
ncbi:glycosyltransferase [Conexibacter sp. W3-3-2]|uniref:glycosyltransferase n=1 Tax=Conexibacter sp. W3-3-2 TaxID=2675227 RepID=UPI0012B6CA0A|nr:glycosyltransferase [Conexibacter sp. W3-3-2]MTD44039.1 glycosyltransferase [Conexibacter sp. W3-3-2]